MSVERKPQPTEFYWELAEGYLARDHVDEGKLMGFPCLRVNGDFFSTCDHRTGELIVKLPRNRVSELIADGTGQPFAPNGKVFKEWLLVPHRDEARLTALMDEALAFVGGGE